MTERDPIVAVALARRPVPDHAPGFWQELEARLAGPPTDAEQHEDTEATVIPLTATPSRRRRWLVLAAGVAATAALTTVAVARLNDDDSEDVVVITNPTTVTPTSSAPAPTSAPTPAPTTPPPPPSEPPFLEAFPGVWPFTSYAEVADYLTAGSTEYVDPRAVVGQFAADVVGVVDPVVGELTPSDEDGLEGTVEVRTRTEAGGVNTELPPTVVAVRRVGDNALADVAGPWVVTGATSEDVTIESPAGGAVVNSPLTVAGQGRGYEGTVGVTLQAGATTLVEPVGTIAGNPELAPYSVELTFEVPPAGTPLMLIARTDTGADFVGVPAFAVTRVVAGSVNRATDPHATVAAFLDAVSAGETDTAWATLDPAAQAVSGGRDAFAEHMRADLVARLAPLADVPADAYTLRRWLPTTEAEPDIVVVTVATGANTGDSAAAFAVTEDGRLMSTFHADTDLATTPSAGRAPR